MISLRPPLEYLASNDLRGGAKIGALVSTLCFDQNRELRRLFLNM